MRQVEEKLFNYLEGCRNAIESLNPFKYSHFLIFFKLQTFPTLHDTSKNKRERLAIACFVLPVNLFLSNTVTDLCSMHVAVY